MGLLSGLREFHPVQDFIALVDSRSSLLLARKARRVVEVADDPPILEMQLRREIKLNRPAAETSGYARGSHEKLPGHSSPSGYGTRCTHSQSLSCAKTVKNAVWKIQTHAKGRLTDVVRPLRGAPPSCPCARRSGAHASRER